MQDLSIFGMFWQAGPVVKGVMLLLLTFSTISWFIVFKKAIAYRRANRESEEFLDTFWKCKNIAEAYRAAQSTEHCPEANIFSLGYLELQKLIKRKPNQESESTFEMRLAGMETLKRTLQKAENLEITRLGKALNFLATTGSATPFIGLFGTVWGIMASFEDIGRRGSASLSVVAPGISEALVATAAGLAVAIPAVIFFNHFSNQLSDIEGNIQRFSSDFLNLVERDLISRQ